MPLSLRTIKISLSALIAILLANFLQLQNPLSAGIIAILSVLDTARSSIETAQQRLISTLLALGTATIIFNLLGYSYYTFALYLAIYVPLAYRSKAQAGIAPCSVLVTHLLVEESTSPSLLVNELCLMVIGAGVAILLNLYMPSHSQAIAALLKEADATMKEILYAFARILGDNSLENEKEQVPELKRLLDEAESLVYVEAENRLLEQSDYDRRYIEMRREQARILSYMTVNLRQCHIPLQEGKVLGEMFYLTAEQLHETNTGKYLLQDIDLLYQHFRNSPLPHTREEFENRAILFQLLNDFARFIQIKRDFHEQIVVSKGHPRLQK